MSFSPNPWCSYTLQAHVEYFLSMFTGISCLGTFFFFNLGEKQSDKGRSVSVCIGKRTLLNQLPVLDWEKHKESLPQSQAILKRNRQSLVTNKKLWGGKISVTEDNLICSYIPQFVSIINSWRTLEILKCSEKLTL